MIGAWLCLMPASALSQTVLTPRVSLEAPGFRDQDDMCFWIHPVDPTLSTIITADKAAGDLFVYDLAGSPLQTIQLPGGQPGNVDVRYNFDLQGIPTDIVGVNDRNTRKLMIFRIDPVSRALERIDDASLDTAPRTYGFAFYVSPITGKYYVFSPTEDGVVEQFELTDAAGRIAGTLVRSWDLGGITEGTVCDDQNGVVFFGEEDEGIWKFGAEPNDPTVPTAVATVGDSSGLTDDVEGLTIYYAAAGGGYLIASSQGSNEFKVYDRRPPHAFLHSFSIEGVVETDGIDAINLAMGPQFPAGIFAAHSHFENAPTPIKLCGFEDLGLPVDIEYWNPRLSGLLPVILSFAPTLGPIGTEVTITGTRFTGVTSVRIGEIEAVEFAVDSDTRIRAVVPGGASTGRIRITTTHGSGVSSTNFGVPEPPTLESFSPSLGPVGTEVLVLGTGLLTTTAVDFAGIPATFDVSSDVELRAIVPAGATTGPIRIVNTAGFALSAEDFEVTAVPAPVTLGPAHDTRVLSSNPTATYGAGGTLRVRSATANPAYRTYLKFDVGDLGTTVAGATLRLFCADSSSDGGAIYSVSNDELGTTTPWEEGTLDWNRAPELTEPPLDQQGRVDAGNWYEFDVSAAVTGPGTYSFGMSSTSTNIAGFGSKESIHPPELVIALEAPALPPEITSFTPTAGPAGIIVTITGAQFEPVTGVDFNGAEAVFVIDSGTQLRATVPIGATTGPIRVTSPNGTRGSPVDFTVTAPPPSIVTFTPSHDSRVVSSTPDLTYGAGLMLRVRSATAVPAYRSYFKFDVTGLDRVVRRATLRLFCADSSVDGGTVYSVSNDFLGTATPWVEASLNWNNAPDLGVALDQQGVVNGGAWYDFDVTAAITGNGTFSFGLNSASTNIAAYRSKESEQVPELVIELGEETIPVPPTIVDFAPANGPIGTEVTVTGAGFATASAVTFNGSAATFAVDSDTQLRATVLAGATSGPIRVDNPGGFAVSATEFTVTAPPPSIVTFTPSHDSRVVSSTPDLTYGAGLMLRVRSATAVPAYRSYFKFDVAGLDRVVRRATLRLFCADSSVDGGTVYSVSNDFLGTATPWVEASLNWNNAPDLGVALDQQGVVNGGAWYDFDVTAAITGNGTVSFGMNSASTNIAAYRSKESEQVPELVIELGEETIPVPPTIVDFAPANGPVGTEVTVAGAGFATASAVTFNGSAATFAVDSDTQLRATVPAGDTSGPIRVDNPGGFAVSATEFTVTPPPPSIVTFTPSHDSRVVSSTPDLTYGAGLMLRVRSATAVPAYRSYFKFDVAGLDRVVRRATLRLFCADSSVDGGTVYSVSNDFLGTATPWVEASLNWNNAPDLGVALDQQGVVNGGAWYDFDVTAAITGNGTFSFGLNSASTNIAAYRSKESEQVPELVIELEPTVNLVRSARVLSTASISSIALGVPRPNPFSHQTSVRLDLPLPARVKAVVYDVNGRVVRNLGLLDLGAGSHDLTWDGRDANSQRSPIGHYWLKVDVAGISATRRLTHAR